MDWKEVSMGLQLKSRKSFLHSYCYVSLGDHPIGEEAEPQAVYSREEQTYP